MELHLGDEDGEVILPTISETRNPKTNHNPEAEPDLVEYLREHMRRVTTSNSNYDLEVLNVPVTQFLYRQFDPQKVFDKEDAEYPADKISWIDAIKFCNWLSEKFGKKPCYSEKEDGYNKEWECDLSSDGYRLPTKDDWFFVAREGIANSDFLYSGHSIIGKVAWYFGNSSSCIQKVGQLAHNKLGLYDLSGNVWEWCWDKHEYNDTRYACGGCVQSNEEICKIVGNGKEFDIRSSEPFMGFRIYRYIQK